MAHCPPLPRGEDGILRSSGAGALEFLVRGLRATDNMPPSSVAARHLLPMGEGKWCAAPRHWRRETEYDAEETAHKAAKAVWNGWAEDMLAKRKALEEAGEWAVDRRRARAKHALVDA